MSTMMTVTDYPQTRTFLNSIFLRSSGSSRSGSFSNGDGEGASQRDGFGNRSNGNGSNGGIGGRFSPFDSDVISPVGRPHNVGGGGGNGAIGISGGGGRGTMSDEEKVSKIIRVLDDRQLGEFSRPEIVRDVVGGLLKQEGEDLPSASLDELVLNLLHRHRADLESDSGIPSSSSASPMSSLFSSSRYLHHHHHTHSNSGSGSGSSRPSSISSSGYALSPSTAGSTTATTGTASRPGSRGGVIGDKPSSSIGFIGSTGGGGGGSPISTAAVTTTVGSGLGRVIGHPNIMPSVRRSSNLSITGGASPGLSPRPSPLARTQSLPSEAEDTVVYTGEDRSRGGSVDRANIGGGGNGDGSVSPDRNTTSLASSTGAGSLNAFANEFRPRLSAANTPNSSPPKLSSGLSPSPMARAAMTLAAGAPPEGTNSPKRSSLLEYDGGSGNEDGGSNSGGSGKLPNAALLSFANRGNAHPSMELPPPKSSSDTWSFNHSPLGTPKFGPISPAYVPRPHSPAAQNIPRNPWDDSALADQESSPPGAHRAVGGGGPLSAGSGGGRSSHGAVGAEKVDGGFLGASGSVTDLRRSRESSPLATFKNDMSATLHELDDQHHQGRHHNVPDFNPDDPFGLGSPVPPSYGAFDPWGDTAASTSSPRQGSNSLLDVVPTSGGSGNGSITPAGTYGITGQGPHAFASHSPTGEGSDPFGLQQQYSQYEMTPLDVLYTIFASSNAGINLTQSDLEEALALNGWDVDKTVEWIMEAHSRALANASSGMPTPGDRQLAMDAVMRDRDAPLSNRNLSGSGSRPTLISRDSFERQFKGSRPGTPSGGPRYGRPVTPGGGGGGGGGGGSGGNSGATKVCRYYLQGACLRSDCRYSHDVSKAVCKFWLRGNCLKGEERCGFLHSIPPVMRAELHQRRYAGSLDPETEFPSGMPEGEGNAEYIDFPSLETAVNNPSKAQLDPSRTRFSNAVKFGRPAPSRAALNRERERERSPALQPRPSPRVNLRPPTLLPTLKTGPELAALYSNYREQFLELGAMRNKLLARAADAWQKGDGASARKWSREANDVNRRVAIAGREAAARILDERRRSLKEAVASHNWKAAQIDERPDRAMRGRDVGGGLGVVLGVVAQRADGPQLNPEERTEAAIDLHGLHPDEALEFLERFLSALEAEQFLGQTYLIVGKETHTGTADPARGAAKARLAYTVMEYLSANLYPWRDLKTGIIVVDAAK